MQSKITAILPIGSKYNLETVKSRIPKDFKIGNIEEHEELNRFKIKILKDSVEYEVFYDTNLYPVTADFSWKELTEDEIESVKSSKHFLSLITDIKVENPGEAFLEQVTTLITLAPDAVILLDETSFRINSGDWARDVLQNQIVPNPERMYSIHPVFQDEELWIHSHGLERFGLKNIEMLKAEKSKANMYIEFFNYVVKRLMNDNKVNLNEEIVVGNKFSIVLREFNKVNHRLGSFIVGNRNDRNENHPTDNLIILESNGKNLLGQEKFSLIKDIEERLANNPIFFISKEETQRMSQLAQKKFKDFAELFIKYKDSDDFKFLAKFGYEFDEPVNGGDEKEHLWFEVLDVKGEELKVKLLNKPYHVEKLKVNEVYNNNIENLTDLLIGSKIGTFSPDEFYDLIRRL